MLGSLIFLKKKKKKKKEEKEDNKCLFQNVSLSQLTQLAYLLQEHLKKNEEFND